MNFSYFKGTSLLSSKEKTKCVNFCYFKVCEFCYFKVTNLLSYSVGGRVCIFVILKELAFSVPMKKQSVYIFVILR